MSTQDTNCNNVENGLLQQKRKHRRRSWFQHPLSNLFAARHQQQQQEERRCTQRSQSMDATTRGDWTTEHPDNQATTHSFPKPSSLASLISKAARHGLRKLPTSTDLHSFKQQQQQQRPDSSFGLKLKRTRSSRRAATVPESLVSVVQQPQPSSPPQPAAQAPTTTTRQSSYLMTTSEEEADRIQLKNDLVKLAFEG